MYSYKYEDTAVQDAFLQKIKDNEINVAIFLKSGIRLVGFVEDFDCNTIIQFSKDNKIKKQLIYKHSIATISIL